MSTVDAVETPRETVLCQRWNWDWEPKVCTYFCGLPDGHRGECERKPHDCPDCGITHGVCAHCWARTHLYNDRVHCAHTDACKHAVGQSTHGRVTEEQARELILLARALYGDEAVIVGEHGLYAEGFGRNSLRRRGGYVAHVLSQPPFDGYFYAVARDSALSRWSDSPEDALVRLLEALRSKADKRLRYNRKERDESRAQDKAIRAALNPCGSRDEADR